jgi:hypothetical protein
MEELERPEFEIKDILPIALMIGVAGIAIAYTLQIMGDIKTDIGIVGCNSSQQYNITGGWCYPKTGFGTTENTTNYPGSAQFNATQDAICISA